MSTTAAHLATVLHVSEATATELLQTVDGDFRQLCRSLSSRPLTTAKDRTLYAIAELAREYATTPWQTGVEFAGAQQVFEHYRESLAGADREQFVIVALDQKHRKLRDIVVSVGSLSSSIVHPRDAYRQVLLVGAAAIILVHNHPSGDPRPSEDDIALTKRLRDVADLLGIRVLDHVVIGKGSYFSFVERGAW